MAESPPAPSFRHMLESGKYSDLTLLCDETSFRVHRVIMCAHSPWFERMCGDDLEGPRMVHINISGDPTFLSNVIEFAYTGKYVIASGPLGEPDQVSAMMSHANIFFLAKKFGMEALKIESSKNYQQAAGGTQDDAARYWSTIWDLVYRVYESRDMSGSEDRFLRDGLCRFLHNHRRDKELWARMQEFFEDHGQLAIDLLNYWNKEED
ncbi:hypothetical protein MAPG_09591 [Magnaporthiopsis poae ATCC 64411]|uniref:BTB domain-containing protein n=1 Tax=Magnaporthiopsis poae (strain ATCC 64411 / 73-15) TaxID=644358 RepID=A0A0C4EAC5_MAGP6|nr:hypothetical protein MAPG_09591 [Magnaporthiopsis poae ATCC 64411]